MLRFLLPAFALTGALLVLFAGALSDFAGTLSNRLTSSGTADLPPRFTSTSPGVPGAQPQPDVQRPVPATPGTQQPDRKQAAPDVSQPQVEALQQQATALQRQLAQRSQELEQRTKELQQRTRDVQAVQVEVDRLKQGMDSARQQRQADGAKLSQLAARSAELDQRSQELDARKRDLDKRSHDAEAAQAEALRLRQVVDAVRQQNKADQQATVARPKTDEASAARQKAKQQQTAALSPQEPAASPPPARPSDAAVPAQQLMTARQWLAAGRPDEARRLLATAQTQMVLQPVTPDAPDAQGANVPATEIGNAIRLLDMGASRQAMQAINRAIEAADEPLGKVRAWSGYQAYTSSAGYSQPFTPR